MTLLARRRVDRPAVPDGMPLLAAGAHADPATGACLLEYTSLLAGERFSDHPKSVHPVLAAGVRVANDIVADDVRPRLLPLAPDLLDTSRAGYAADPVLVGIVGAAAAEAHPASAHAPVAVAAAKRRLRRMAAGGWHRRCLVAISARHYRATACRTVAVLMADDVSAAGDSSVVAVLQAVVGECRRRAVRVSSPGYDVGIRG